MHARHVLQPFELLLWPLHPFKGLICVVFLHVLPVGMGGHVVLSLSGQVLPLFKAGGSLEFLDGASLLSLRLLEG